MNCFNGSVRGRERWREGKVPKMGCFEGRWVRCWWHRDGDPGKRSEGWLHSVILELVGKVKVTLKVGMSLW